MASTLVEEQAIFLFQNPLDEPKLDQQFEKPVPQQDNISIPVKQEVPSQQPLQMQQPQIQMQQPQMQAQPQFQQPPTIQPQMQMQQPQMMYQQPIQGQPQIQYIATPVNYAMNPNIVQQPMMQQQFMNPQMNYSNNTSGNAMFMNSYTNPSMAVTTTQTNPNTCCLKTFSGIMISIGIINIAMFIVIILSVYQFGFLFTSVALNGIFCIIAGIVGLIKASDTSKSSTPAVVMASIAIFFTVINLIFGFFWYFYSIILTIGYKYIINLLTIISEIVLIVLAVQAKPRFVTQQKELFLEMQGGK